MKNEKRFVKLQKDSGLTHEATILVDTVTGVHYLFVQGGYAGGLTPLLDENGQVVIDRDAVNRWRP